VYRPVDMIRTVELTKRYPGTDGPAVDGLDLSVSQGEVFGLLGPNGAGKTTTAGMLTTRVIPSSGSAFVAGVDVVRHPTQVKQLIGVTSQRNTLDRALTVWENLYFHGRLFGIGGRSSRRLADELLERFKLSRWARSQVDTLSGGLAQRLMVARSVMHRPLVLFLDEPTTGLDPQSRLAFWEIVRELHEAGQTVLLTTHYMEEAEALCDRVAIVDRGRVIALGTTARLKASLPNSLVVTAKADGDPNRLLACLTAAVSPASSRIIDGGVELQLPAKVSASELIRAADAEGLEVTELSLEEPSLETVFISLTGRELRD
jgi:ABC-2 type transport system ATP-binding protein